MDFEIEERLKRIEDNISAFKDNIENLTGAIKETIGYVREEKEEEERESEELIFVPIFKDYRVKQLARAIALEKFGKEYNKLNFRQRMEAEITAKLEMLKNKEFRFILNPTLRKTIDSIYYIAKPHWDMELYIGPYKSSAANIKVIFPFVQVLDAIRTKKISEYTIKQNVPRNTYSKIKNMALKVKETGDIIPFLPTDEEIFEFIKAGYV